MRGHVRLLPAIAGAALATLAGAPGQVAATPPDPGAAGPSTRIAGAPGPKTFERRPRFRFDSPSDPSARFRCSLAHRRWRSCSSPYRSLRLRRGRHTFRVRAVNAEGEMDSTPAARRFRILRRHVTLGRSVRGQRLRAVRLGNPNAARKALVVGSIHGNETEGHEIVRILARRYRDLRGTELWVVKTVNPDGADADRRQNVRGVDLNRNFSYRWSGAAASSAEDPGPHPFSEPESRAVRRLARRLEPRVTIWYHQPWGQVLLPCHGPAPAQRRYARISGLPTKRCRGQRLRGTATSWQNHRSSGTAFVVELPGGELPNRQARRHARAAATVASRGRLRGHHRSPGRRQRSPEKIERPSVDRDPIPYGGRRRHQMASYSKRHYGKRRWRLRNPRVIVLHYTASSTYRSAWETFAANAPNNGERPGVCSHFVVAKNGRIHRLVRPAIRCRHAIGLNHRALGVEMVQEAGPGSRWADRRILHRHRQIGSALRLVGWLKQRFGIRMRDVIGHSMANGSRFFKDLAGWRNDHTDWLPRDTFEFRHQLRRLLQRSG
jgi:zinc carboxypeptidase/N-acetylmuramoyl-L-alanine amidase-like protein